MAQNVLITGTGREMALGFNLVRRYLEHGDHVIATIRTPSEALEKLKLQYQDQLDILTMDISDTASVLAAAEQAAELVPCLDLLINNAVTTTPDINNELAETDLDLIADAMNVTAVGPIRVIKAMLPLLQKSEGVALIVNVSSEAGSIGRCYRTTYYDYAMGKAALNMATKTLHNQLKKEQKINIICLHPGWMRTNEGNAKAPLVPYEHAETLRLLFERRREDFDGPVFVTFEGDAYPW